jgi:hypothetical protein
VEIGRLHGFASSAILSVGENEKNGRKTPEIYKYSLEIWKEHHHARKL